MTPVFADTFYFVAALNRQDQAHARAKSFQWRNRLLVTTAWVLTEVGDAMAAPKMRAGFIELIDFLSDSEDALILGPNSELFDAGLELFRNRPDKEWSLTDCISFEAMRSAGITEALTTDHHFVQAGFQVLFKKEDV